MKFHKIWAMSSQTLHEMGLSDVGSHGNTKPLSASLSGYRNRNSLLTHFRPQAPQQTIFHRSLTDILYEGVSMSKSTYGCHSETNMALHLTKFVNCS